MSKPKIDVQSSNLESNIPILPSQVDTTEIDPKERNRQQIVEKGFDMKVSKADTVNLITVQLRLKLEEEIRQINQKISKATAKKGEIRSSMRAEFENNLKKNYPKLKIRPDRRFSAFNGKFRTDDTNDGIFAHVVIDLELPKPKNSSFPVISGESPYIEREIYWNSPAIKELNEEIRLLNLEKLEVDRRLALANDSKLIRAQLDMGLIGSLPNGKTAVDNINRLVESMSNTVLQKREPLQLTE